MENQMTTKEKIIIESLKLFSQKGYEGVSMREIAGAVGIKGASLYNHFLGKEAIFRAIFDEMTKRYDASAMAMHIPTAQDEQTVAFYLGADPDTLFHFAEGLFGFFCQDDFMAMFRKLLVGEQHHSPMAAEMLKQYYLDAPVLFQKQIFEGMQAQGSMAGFDAGVMALHFYSPIHYLLCQFDLGCPYGECLRQLTAHVRGFCGVYTKPPLV